MLGCNQNKIFRVLGVKIALYILLIVDCWSQASSLSLGQAGEVRTSIINGVKHTIFNRSVTKRVVFIAKKDLVFCNKAIRNEVTQDFRAYGDVLIKQSNNTKIRGDTLIYVQHKDMIIIRGSTSIEKNKSKVYAPILYYNIENSMGYYLDGGTIIQENMKMSSQEGYLDNSKNVFSFSKNVVMDDLENHQRVLCDTLVFLIDKDIAIFPSSTLLKSEGSILYTDSGEYYLETGVFNCKGSTVTENEDIILSSNYILQDQDGNIEAIENVVLFLKEDSITIYGDRMITDSSNSYFEVYGRPMMKKPIGKKDTLFLIADTLIGC